MHWQLGANWVRLIFYLVTLFKFFDDVISWLEVIFRISYPCMHIYICTHIHVYMISF